MTPELRTIIELAYNNTITSATVKVDDHTNLIICDNQHIKLRPLYLTISLLELMIKLDAQFDTSGNNIQIVIDRGVLRIDPGIPEVLTSLADLDTPEYNIFFQRNIPFIFNKSKTPVRGIRFKDFIITKSGKLFYKGRIEIPRLPNQSIHQFEYLIISYKALDLIAKNPQEYTRLKESISTEQSKSQISITMKHTEDSCETGRFFIAKIENGFPKFSTSPRSHESLKLAKQEIRRLKGLHPVTEFRIYPEISYDSQILKIVYKTEFKSDSVSKVNLNGML